MTNIYRYILAYDGGMAPCPADGLITLATCKPVVRRMARPGDWVAGFLPGSLERGLILWAGKVSQVIEHGDYQKQFRQRPDAVYRLNRSGTYVRLAPDYHPSADEMTRDLSGPVLIFDQDTSVYLNGVPESLPSHLQHLAPGGRGHRVNGVHPEDIAQFEAWVAGLRDARAGEMTIPITDPADCRRPKRTSLSGCRPSP